MKIAYKEIGREFPCFIVAELSANHNQNYKKAVELIHASKEAGVDAVKLQTYTPDTLTINCNNEYFRIKGGTPWKGQLLYNLYQKAFMPWDWQPKLKEEADKLGLILFSTPFDKTAVHFLTKMDIDAYKISSFELVDISLIRYIAEQGKPLIVSTGMANLSEIYEAVNTIKKTGNEQMALLKCVSDYPANPEDMNLKTIPNLAQTFNIPIGLSDHTLGRDVAVASIALGACVIEKHLTLSRAEDSPDAKFSMEPHEFKEMVEAVRLVEKALGKISFEPSENEKKNRVFRRSLFVVRDVKAGEKVTCENVRSIRPGYGLHTRYLDQIIGRIFRVDAAKGTPLDWDFI